MITASRSQTSQSRNSSTRAGVKSTKKNAQSENALSVFRLRINGVDGSFALLLGLCLLSLARKLLHLDTIRGAPRRNRNKILARLERCATAFWKQVGFDMGRLNAQSCERSIRPFQGARQSALVLGHIRANEIYVGEVWGLSELVCLLALACLSLLTRYMQVAAVYTTRC